MLVLRGARRGLRAAGLRCAEEQRGSELRFKVFPVRLGGVREYEGSGSATATVHATCVRN